MGGVYSIAALIVWFAIIGVALSHTETANIIRAITSGFSGALTAAKP